MQRPSLAAVRPDLAAQWHPTRNAFLTPADVTPGSGKRVWWLDGLKHEWESTVNNRNNGTGCPFCSGNRVLTGFNDLATRVPDIAAEWHPIKNGDLTPDLVAASGGRKYWWQCEDGHEWQMTVGNRTFGDQGCPVCAGQRVLPGVNDIATTAPGLAAEWHPSRNAPLTPQQVFRSTARKLWWQCSLGHDWEASANSRSNGSNCPFCSGQRILIGFNDLASVRPEIAAEWHPTRNHRTPQTVTAMNGTKLWWRCERDGHEWSTTVASRSRGNGCPACAGQTVRTGVNDLASRAPAVAAEWHPTRNGDLPPTEIAVFSNRKAWWRCAAGHEWESTVNNRTHGQGCPECAERGGFNPGRPGYLYLLEHPGFEALKVGVTNEGTTRLAMFQARGWQVLNLEYFHGGADAVAIERTVKVWWRRDLRLPAWLGPAEMSATGGWTETIASAELAAATCIERVRAEAAAARSRSRDPAATHGVASGSVSG